ncbi:zeaxanthin epoxidase, chloroplastic [Beta vulgaris subsp. vulgaris]|uniref:zeaxanthin epoxidase, chloroplastic n=1 Tax=Beta vulgaris subsp. vulgaris TaxID=3555 RepID=UPI002036F600|nr:zeaxanthin epoxidase, chloroplastic [Beta vulgaris subsp. vulgaris]
MASTVIYNSLTTSSTVFLRTHLPILSQYDEQHQSSLIYNSKYYLKKPNFSGQKKKEKKEIYVKCSAAVAESLQTSPATNDVIAGETPEKKLRILVAGGGIGGLVFALAAKKKGFDVVVFEKDLSAIRGEGKYRGPIQVQSNALAALEAIDMDVAEKVMDAGCVTGDRINGLVDGISGNWYVKFDTFTPAVERGLPVTRVISRMTLQQILAQAVGEEVIMNESNVVSFKDDGSKVTVVLDNGTSYEGDLLVGADGIWSKVRTNLFGHTEAVYSGYTCYTGIADFVPADIDSVGYRVFLGHKQYFVSSDVGGGKMQWYAFHKESAGGADQPNGKKQRLLEIFGGWCDNVTDLLVATDEEAILRRDIYDRTPKFTWGEGRITLLGDSVHAMQPNLGQGGCMAIEDSYELARGLEKAWQTSVESGKPVDVVSSLRSYESARKLRVAIIHGLARMAAVMATTYKPFLGVGLGPLSFLTKFKIPHPGRVGGRVFISPAMPLMLSWVLGGNSEKLEGRVPHCRLSEKANNQLRRWFEDDDALERALSGEWFLLPQGNDAETLEPICLSRKEDEPCTIGSVSHEDLPGVSVALRSPQVSERHARISCKDGAFFLTDLRSEHGTWITDKEGRHYRVPPNFPTRFHPSDIIQFGSDKKASYRVKVSMTSPNLAQNKQNAGVLQTV